MSRRLALDQLLQEALKSLKDHGDLDNQVRVMRIRTIIQLFVRNPYSSNLTINQAVDINQPKHFFCVKNVF
jgi:hypothetical protein